MSINILLPAFALFAMGVNIGILCIALGWHAKVYRVFNGLAYGFYSKLIPHRIGNREVYLINGFAIKERFCINLCNFEVTKREQFKTLLVNLLGYKKAVPPDVIKEVERLGDEFWTLASILYAIRSQAIECPDVMRKLFIEREPLFVDGFLEFLLSQEKLKVQGSYASKKNTKNAKNTGNKD